jgi:hypothetical protein
MFLYASEACMSILIPRMHACMYIRTIAQLVHACSTQACMLSLQGMHVHHLRLQLKPQSLRMVYAAPPQSTHVADTCMPHARGYVYAHDCMHHHAHAHRGIYMCRRGHMYQTNVPHHQQPSALTLPYTSFSHINTSAHEHTLCTESGFLQDSKPRQAPEQSSRQCCDPIVVKSSAQTQAG